MTQLHMDLRGDFDRIKPEFAVGVPRIVTFRASTVATDEGTPLNTAISVRIENGDVYGLLDAIAENGGIGVETDDGVYRFIPWPCALVEVRDA